MIVIAVLALLALAEGNPYQDRYQFQKTCEKNGVNFTQIEFESLKLIHCLESDFGAKKLETELKDAYLSQNYDTLNEVIKKYCRKSSALKGCYHKYVEVVSPCFGNDHQELIQATHDLNEQIVNYLCEDDGRLLAEFASTGGPHCFEEKTYDIAMCTERAKHSLLYVQGKPHPLASDSYQVYDEFLKCVCASVNTCKTSVPTKILEKLIVIVENKFDKAAQATSKPGDNDVSSERAPAVSSDSVQCGQNGNSKPQKKIIKAFGNVTFTISGDIFV